MTPQYVCSDCITRHMVDAHPLTHFKFVRECDVCGNTSEMYHISSYGKEVHEFFIQAYAAYDVA